MRRALPLILFLSILASAQEKPADTQKTQPFPTLLDPCAADNPPPCVKKLPKAIYNPPAKYSEEALKQGIEGTVPLRLIVTSDGSVMDLLVVDHTPLGHGLEESALAAVRQWKFEPARDQNDKPAAVVIGVKIRFHLDHADGSTHEKPLYVSEDARSMPRSIPDAPRPQPELPAEVQKHVATAPKVIESVQPHYTDEARKKRIQGTATLSAVIGTDGKPSDIRVERRLGHGLDEKAIEALEQWRFAPATQDGVPVSTRITVRMEFALY